MNNKTFDEFLDDATHLVAERWAKTKGRPFDNDDLYVLNELLEEHFKEYLVGTEISTAPRLILPRPKGYEVKEAE